VNAAHPPEVPGAPSSALVLELDGAACDGHGICLLCCPERVSLDEWGFAVVDRTPIRDRATLRRAERAVRACPTGALRLEPRAPARGAGTTGAMPHPPRKGATR